MRIKVVCHYLGLLTAIVGSFMLLPFLWSLFVVAGGWILASLLGTLPYALSGTFASYYDACFESVSGFTTTGATVLTSIETQLESILLWRSITQWLGGMGIITLFVALFPMLGIGAAHLVEAEMPGPDAGRLTPRIRDTAKSVWLLYVGFSGLEFIMLLIAGPLPISVLLLLTVYSWKESSSSSWCWPA